ALLRELEFESDAPVRLRELEFTVEVIIVELVCLAPALDENPWTDSPTEPSRDSFATTSPHPARRSPRSRTLRMFIPDLLPRTSPDLSS
ncbi:MAG: hypothetical protein ACLQBL_27105, partial [Polyangiaceae bacterium]